MHCLEKHNLSGMFMKTTEFVHTTGRGSFRSFESHKDRGIFYWWKLFGASGASVMG